MTFWKGAGNSIGEGLGLMVNSFVSRQDQLKQQQQQEDQLRRQVEQQALDNQLRQQQLEFQRQEAERAARANQFNQDRLTRNDDLAARQEGVKDREGEFRNVLAPEMNGFMEAVNADLARYAPTTKDGRGNPQYDQALYEAAQARAKQARKLWASVGLSVGKGEGWEQARSEFLAFVGGDAPTAPGLPPATPQAAPVPPVAPPQAPAAPAGPAAPPAPMSQSRSAQEVEPPPAPGQAASAPSAPRQPVTPAQLPRTVQEIPPSQLADLDDASLVQAYGQGGLEYARAARAEYAAGVAAQQAAVRKSQTDFWSKAAQNVLDDKDRPATADQMGAAATVMALINLPTLTPEQATQFADAVRRLTPRALSAATWQDVLNTKDPNAILAALPMYRAQAPDVVAAFDPQPYVLAANAALNESAANAAQSYGAAANSNANAASTTAQLPGILAQQGATLAGTEASTAQTIVNTNRTTALLPGELAQQGATLDYTEAQTEGEVADTANTVQDTQSGALDTRQKAYDLGIKTVTNWAKTGATVYQLQKATPQVWAQMKRDLGVNDAGLTALLQLGRFEYGRGLDREDLENRLKASQIATDGAQRAGIIATTARTVQTTANEGAAAPLDRARTAAETANVVSTTVARNAELQPRLDLLNAQIKEAEARGQNTDSLRRERDTLLPLRAAQTTAQTANLWANVANTRSTITARDAKLQPELDRLNAQITTERAQGRNVDSLIRRRDALLPLEVSGAAQQLQIDRDKAAAYIRGQNGNYAVDMARVKQITASTALTRAKDPNDPLYNPVIASSKPGDPVDLLKKKAGVFYTQADQALKQAQTLQTQINGLTKLGTGPTGSFSMDRLSPANQTKLASLTKQRDSLMATAINRRASGDQVITEGMQKLPTSVTSTPGDLYGVKNVGGVKMVTTFTGRAPVPASFSQDARFYISQTAGRLGIDANALAAVISFETGGSFSPKAKNPNSSGSGLIQFMEATAKGMGTTTAALRAMPFGEQMKYVERYLAERGIGPGADIADIYAAVTGSGYRRGTQAYELNKVWDADGNGVIDKGEQVRSPAFQSHVRDYFGGGGAAAGPTPPPARTAAPPRTTPARTTTPAPRPAASKPNTGQLEAGLQAAVQNRDGTALNTYADELVKAGYTPARVQALIKRYQGGS